MRSNHPVVLCCLVSVLALLLLISCSDLLKSEDEDDTTHVLVDAESGGSVSSPDGLLSLTIPPNALNEDTYIDIGVVDPSDYPDEIAGAELAGKVYSLGPDGLALNSPAAVEIEMTEDELDSDVANDEYRVVGGALLSSDGTLEPMDTSTVRYDLEDTILFTGELSHFSYIVRFLRIRSYNPSKSHGRVRISTDLGPHKTAVGLEWPSHVGCMNSTDLELFVDIKNSATSPLDWTGVFTSFDVAPQGFDFKIIGPKWSCEDIGKGRNAVAVYVTPLDGEIETGAHGVYIPQNVECIESVAQATNCGDDRLKFVCQHFWFPFFHKEPCGAIGEPEGDGTVTNSWGLVKDVSQTMVGTYRWGMKRQTIIQDQWWYIEEMYPFGPDNFWIGTQRKLGTGPTSTTGSIGDWVVFFNVMHDTVPPADPTDYFQYGFVFDRDGDTENNYEPHPSYPYDFFQDTDYWIVASYSPGGGWTLVATDATDSAPVTVDSDARMIVNGTTLILLVPREEFLAEHIGYRMTAYRHPGDWGTGGDWDGDVQPPVADGLKWVDIGSD